MVDILYDMASPHLKHSVSDTLSVMVDRLTHHGRLTPEDQRSILSLPVTTRQVPPKSTVVRQGDAGDRLSILLDGYVVRQKEVEDGERQIISLELPGDILNLPSVFLGRADHDVYSLTPAKVAEIPAAVFLKLVNIRPAITRAVLKAALVEGVVYREAMVSLGRRDAKQKLAHFLCEHITRMSVRGLGRDGSFDLPMTQQQIADAIGLTAVHLNRTLALLKKQGLISHSGAVLKVVNLEGLKAIARFSGEYLSARVEAEILEPVIRSR